jgi:geranylgeranyl diphosphate synthase type I
VTIKEAVGQVAAGDRGAMLAEVRNQIDQELTGFLDRRLGHFADPQPLQQIFHLIRQFVLGNGKRIRPLFCYLGWLAAGGTDCEEITRAAASLELFHAFALMHDDIMDDSALRRGRPTLHQLLSDLHLRESWRGHPKQFGVNVAILCGDLCFSYSDELLIRSGLPSQRILAAQDVLHQMRTEVMIGQNLDLLYQAIGTTLEGALTVVRLKAAKYTVERPLQIGGILAGAGDDLLRAYSAFAIPLGEAFQLRDDVLGVFGDPEVTGKPAVDDLRGGKPTVMMAIAAQRATREQADHIVRLHGNPALDDDGAALLREVITSSGARETLEGMIRDRRSQALAALAAIQMPEPAKEALLNLVTMTVDRAA